MTVEEWLGKDNQLGQDIWHKKYQHDNETFDEWIDRISNKNDKVVITTVMGIYDTSNKSLYNYKNVYTPIAVDLNNNFNIQDYQNKLDTYKYTFIKDNEEYHFDSISS